MQISPPSPALVSSLAGSTAALDKAGKSSQNPLVELATSAAAVAPVESGRGEVDTVSLSAEVRSREVGNAPAPVYAEIWKGAIKVAQVDIYGQVVSYSGLVPAGGGGVAGPLLAAQRAIQVAQQTGGEIRAAGQALDNQTLMMRARLASAYAV
jgi:hypothetical protein